MTTSHKFCSKRQAAFSRPGGGLKRKKRATTATPKIGATTVVSLIVFLNGKQRIRISGGITPTVP